MHWIQLTLIADLVAAEPISELFHQSGAIAVTFHNAGQQPIFEPELQTTPLWNKTQVIGLFDANADIKILLQQLKKNVSQEVFHSQRIEILSEKDWIREYQQNFQPLKFGKNLWVCPSWHKIPDNHAVNIILDPGLAFGTGTHATTALCLEWLEANIKNSEVVIDYGCGSGILAIAALKLGAKQSYAIDIDPQALTAVETNRSSNQLSTTQLLAFFPQHLPIIKVDILIANILAKPLIELAETFSSLIKSQGKLVLSGILLEQVTEVCAVYQPWFKFSPPIYKDEWARLEGVKER